jgi:hypothetical protein
VFTPILLSTQLSRDVTGAGQVHRTQRERRYLQ